MIKAVFFDIDGTLVSFKTHKLPDSTVRALDLLREKGIKVYRTFVGEYATSMEMAGASISICRMADQEMKQWMDMPVHTPFYTQV